jgi:hypothetical protein
MAHGMDGPSSAHRTEWSDATCVARRDTGILIR